MSNGREDTPSLSDPHYLEKTLSINDTMHYLLLLSPLERIELLKKDKWYNEENSLFL
jgi:hypothetical protein